MLILIQPNVILIYLIFNKEKKGLWFLEDCMEIVAESKTRVSETHRGFFTTFRDFLKPEYQLLRFQNRTMPKNEVGVWKRGHTSKQDSL